MPTPSDPDALLSSVLTDPAAFARRLNIKLKDGRVAPFGSVMSREQESLLTSLGTHDRVAIVKARQMGFSTVSRSYGFWRAMMNPNHVSAILSNKGRGAKELLKIDRRFYEGLPEGLAPALDTNTTSEMSFAHGSRLTTFSGKASNDRGYTLGTLHVTEYSHIEDGPDVLATLMGSLGPNGKVIVESTPGHYGDPLHKLVQAAAYKDVNPVGGRWHVVFHPWFSFASYSKALPAQSISWNQDDEAVRRQFPHLTEEQLYWRKCKVEEYSGDTTLFRREFPSTLDEAYALAEGAYYSHGDLQHVVAGSGAVTTIPACSLTKETLRPYEHVKRGCYVIGVDPAGGTGGDYSVAYVWDRAAMKPACVIHTNRANLRQFTEQVVVLAKDYGNAHVHYELNNHGQGFKQAIASLGYNNVKEWTTTEKSKVDLHETMRALVCSRMVDELDSTTLQEIRSLARSDRGLAPSASQGNHDDRVIALALALKMHALLPPVAKNGGTISSLIGPTSAILNGTDPRGGYGHMPGAR
jgi:hypothetical protein